MGFATAVVGLSGVQVGAMVIPDFRCVQDVAFGYPNIVFEGCPVLPQPVPVAHIPVPLPQPLPKAMPETQLAIVGQALALEQLCVFIPVDWVSTAEGDQLGLSGASSELEAHIGGAFPGS